MCPVNEVVCSMPIGSVADWVAAVGVVFASLLAYKAWTVSKDTLQETRESADAERFHAGQVLRTAQDELDWAQSPACNVQIIVFEPQADLRRIRTQWSSASKAIVTIRCTVTLNIEGLEYIALDAYGGRPVELGPLENFLGVFEWDSRFPTMQWSHIEHHFRNEPKAYVTLSINLDYSLRGNSSLSITGQKRKYRIEPHNNDYAIWLDV